MELCNKEAEACLIACLINSHDKDTLSDIFISCSENDFTDEEYQRIFISAYRLFKNDRSVDIITVGETDKSIRLDTLLGTTKLIPSYANYKQYIDIVKAKTYGRKLISVAEDIKSNKDENPFSVRDKAITELSKIGDTEKEIPNMSQIIDDVFKELESRKDGSYGLQSIKTPYRKLNYYMPLNGGEMYVIAARPGIGKSAFASEILLNAALRNKKSVAFFNLEMSEKDIVKRMFSNRLQVSITDFENSNVDTTKVATTAEILRQSKLYIDTTCFNIEKIIRACKIQKKKTGLDLVCVDYLQLVGAQGKFDSRNNEVAYVSRQLKLMAMELNIPVIAISQMNRSFEKGDDRPPQLSDLRESGAIEQDASGVVFLYRDKKKETALGFREDLDRYLVALIAKNRNGATGSFCLKFRGDKMSFEEIERDGKPLVENWKPQAQPKQVTLTETNEDLPF